MHEKEEIFTRLKTATLKKENLRIIEQLERVKPARADLLDPGLFEMLYCHLGDCLFDPLEIRIEWYPGDNLVNIVANTSEIRVGMFFCFTTNNCSCLYKKNKLGVETWPVSIDEFWVHLSVILDKIVRKEQ